MTGQEIEWGQFWKDVGISAGANLVSGLISKKLSDNLTGLANPTTVKKPEVIVRDYVIDYSSPVQAPLWETEQGRNDYRYTYGLQRLSAKIFGVQTSAGDIVEPDQTLKLHYHMDRLGSSTHLTDKFGRIASWTYYDEWGQITHNTVVKVGQRQFDLVKNYTGHNYDSVLDLYYAKARMYDPIDKRFAARDLIKGSVVMPMTLNPYLYVVDNPLRYVDPLGLFMLYNGMPYDSQLLEFINELNHDLYYLFDANTMMESSKSAIPHSTFNATTESAVKLFEMMYSSQTISSKKGFQISYDGRINSVEFLYIYSLYLQKSSDTDNTKLNRYNSMVEKVKAYDQAHMSKYQNVLYYPKFGCIERYHDDDYVGVMYITNTDGANDYGHAALVLIKGSGYGQIYSFAGNQDEWLSILAGVNSKGQLSRAVNMQYEIIPFSLVNFIETGIVNTQEYEKGKKTTGFVQYTDDYDRFIYIPASNDDLYKIKSLADTFFIYNIPDYNLYEFNCSHMAQFLLSQAGLNFSATSGIPPSEVLWNVQTVYGGKYGVIKGRLEGEYNNIMPNYAHDIGVSMAKDNGWIAGNLIVQ